MNDNCPLQSVVAKRRPGVPLDMSRIAPEYLDRDPSDCPTAADVLFRKESGDEEREKEEDEEDEDEEEDEEEEDDDGNEI